MRIGLLISDISPGARQVLFNVNKTTPDTLITRHKFPAAAVAAFYLKPDQENRATEIRREREREREISFSSPRDSPTDNLEIAKLTLVIFN
jgi:hypothetical protein